MFQVRLLHISFYQVPSYVCGRDGEQRIGALSRVSVLKAEIGVEKELITSFNSLFQRK